MTLSKVIGAKDREGSYITKFLPNDKNSLNWLKTPKTTSKITHSDLPGDLNGVTPATNHSVIAKLAYVMLLGLKSGFLPYTTKWLPDHKNGPN